MMKKGLKMAGIVLAALIVLLLVLPMAFKGKIKELVVRQGNRMLDAQFEVGLVNVNLIRNFPKATIVIRDFSLWGVGEFAQDTLASAERILMTVDLGSLFSSEGFDVWQAAVEGVSVRAVVLEDGRPNWDILKSSGDKGEAEQSNESPTFRARLRDVTVARSRVVYDDRQSNIYLSANDFNAAASGDLEADRTTLRIDASVGALTFRYGGVPYLSEAAVKTRMRLDADLKNNIFTFDEGTIALNALQAGIEGMFGMPEDGSYDMDLRLNTEKVGLKELLSLVPAIYAREFASLQASGEVALTAWAKGKMTEETLPAFEASVRVSDGQFRYPSLPKSVDDIQVAASAGNPGGNADATVIDVEKLHFSMAGNPFAVVLNLATPVSDPAFAASARGKLDLGMIREVYPLENMELNGVLNADFDLKGRMSYIEKGQYEHIRASGILQVNDMLLKMSDMPDVRIDRSLLTFGPKYLQLSETAVGIGRSDLTADCRLENYLAFALRGETIRGSMSVRSNLLDLNELTGNKTEPETPVDSASTAAFEVPKNVDFDLHVTVARLYFDNLELDDVKGRVSVNGGNLNMNNLSFNTLQGSVVTNGVYSTAEDPKRPELNASFRMEGLSFGQTFEKFVTIRKLAPIFEGLHGNFSGQAEIRTRMDSLMNVDFATLHGGGNLRTENVNLSGIRALDAVAEAVGRPELKNMQVRDLDLRFTILEGRVFTQPFDIRVGSDMNLNLSGSTGIDRTIDYTGRLKLPASAGIVSNLTTVDLKIDGTFDSPKVSVDMAGMARQAVESAKEMATEKALNEIGKALGVDISDAEKQRDALIEQAEKAGQRLVEEARKQSDALVEKADNPLAKLAAQKAGEALVKEAQKQSNVLVDKAKEEGDKLVEKAKAGER